MSKKQKEPHFVSRTRTPHKCGNCGEIIPIGSFARYHNDFDGKRSYYHSPECPKYVNPNPE